jgi:type IV secretory pathway VirB10-like protein
MRPVRLILLAAALVLPAAAFAQWQWVDKSGRKVFSDQPPPADIPAANIIKGPGMPRGGAPNAAIPATPGQTAAAVPAAAPTPAPAGAAPAPVAAAQPAAPKLPTRDSALEEKKKQAEAAEAEKKKKLEEEQQALRADNCKRAKQSKAMFDSGVRVARTNEKGEREIMDDNQRAAEVKRLEGIIAKDCKAG